MFSRFFIDRPIFASVLSIVIFLSGFISVWTLPIAQYPQITPPTIQVQCNYPGASAKVVAETVAAPIEQQVNGVEKMMYMSSQCTNDGSYNLTVTFEPDVDLNFAQVLVQNRINLALPQLPDVVKQTGLTTRKLADILQVVSLLSPLKLTDRALQSLRDKHVPDVTVAKLASLKGTSYRKRHQFLQALATVLDADELKQYKAVVSDAAQSDRDNLYLSNYATIAIKDEVSRVEGVGDVFVFGARDFSMRVWVDPQKMASRNMTAGDVVKALRAENAPFASGQIGQPPARSGEQFQYPLIALGRLTEPKQFGEIVVKATPDARPVRIKDIGRVELDAKSQDILARLDGLPTTSIAVFQLPDANALATADRVRAKMEQLRNGKNWPDDVEYEIGFDTTPFVRESIQEVVRTLVDAIILVAMVVLLFLQSWRSAIIPLIAVPVAIFGTFAAMAAIHFSLNNLTLFGLVLAIGIVVDDAIVVVEAVEHHIENGMAPRAAAIRAMNEVSGPVVAVALVLTAVFLPCAFISGITGQFFRQFALTIAVSTVISAFNSLTLSPALAALLLRKRAAPMSVNESQGWAHVDTLVSWIAFVAIGGRFGYLFLSGRLESLFGSLAQGRAWLPAVAAIAAGMMIGFGLGSPYFLRFFNAGFRNVTNVYTRLVGLGLRGSVIVLLLYAGMVTITGLGFNGIPGQLVPERLRGTRFGSFNMTTGLPTGYIPVQDKGYLLATVQLPDAAALERTLAVVDQIEEIAHSTPGVAHTISTSGQSWTLGAYGGNFGNFFIPLESFDERRDPELSSDNIARQLRQKIAAAIPDAEVIIFGPPPVTGLGNASGFKFVVEDRSDQGLEYLQSETDNLIAKARADKNLTGVFTIFRVDSPQLFVDVDRETCRKLGVALNDVYNTLQIYLGSLYVNDINRFGRTWQLVAQAEGEFRNNIKNVRDLKVRSTQGAMVPLGTVAEVREVNGPLLLTRYNMYPAAIVQGNTAPGISSGQGIERVEELAEQELPRGMELEWTEIAFLQVKAGQTAALIFVLAVLLVFLVLAAQYESWSLPLAVILVVPTCLLSAITGVAIANSDVNIFTQIGFVVLVGLASKNAILIVEFAKVKREHGMSRREATLEACKLRLRPILMTSFAFILGVVPLLVSSEQEREMSPQTLGTAVFSGMLGVTLFGIFLTPVFFYVINWLSETELFASPLFYAIFTIIVAICIELPLALAAGILLRGLPGMAIGIGIWTLLVMAHFRSYRIGTRLRKLASPARVPILTAERGEELASGMDDRIQPGPR